MPKNSVSEALVLNRCLTYLAERRIFAWRQNTGAFTVGDRFIRYGHPGCADILGVAPDGRFLAVECKAANGRQSSDQKLFEKCVTSRGGIYILARSTDELKQDSRNLVFRIPKTAHRQIPMLHSPRAALPQEV